METSIVTSIKYKIPILILGPTLSISAYLAWIDKYFDIDKQYQHYMEGTLNGSCVCATSWCDRDLTFELAVVNLTYKILSGLYLRNHKVEEVDTRCRHWLRVVGVQCHGVTSLNFDLTVVT